MRLSRSYRICVCGLVSLVLDIIQDDDVIFAEYPVVTQSAIQRQITNKSFTNPQQARWMKKVDVSFSFQGGY